MTGPALHRPRLADALLLTVAVGAISASGPLIALATAPALALAFWRCALGSAATAAVVLCRPRLRTEMRSLDRRGWRQAVAAGLLLGAHFALWMPSVRLTSVAAATALIATQPVWAVLIARWRGEAVSARVWLGVGLALAGVLLLVRVDLAMSWRAVLGDVMALASAVLAAAYVTAGGEVRQRVSAPSYTLIAYGTAAIPPLLIALLLREQVSGFGLREWVLILTLTITAQLLGHTLINITLRRVSPTVTSLAILFELPGAVIIAALLIGQVPPLVVLPVLVILFTGLALVITAAPTGVRGVADEVREDPPV